MVSKGIMTQLNLADL